MAKHNPRPGNNPAKNSNPSSQGDTQRLVVQVEAPRRRLLSMALGTSAVVGRGDSEDQSQPDLDLSTAGAREAGVSRQHARFVYQGETLYIEDMGSTNGTRINGFDLVAGKSYRLTPGDEIELGSLRLTARVVRAPS
jgi:predicted component of type VI protein secretion system